MASWIGLTRINASFGNRTPLAGYQIAIRIIIFALLPAWGLANAAATMVGQSLGAGKPERGEQGSVEGRRFTTWSSSAWRASASSCSRIRSRVAFTKDPGSCADRRGCLRIISYGYLFYAYGMVVDEFL